MPLPTFETQPNEVNVLQPSVVKFFETEKIKTRIIDGLFDLLLSSPSSYADSYLELKVRLASQGRKCPISPAQWRLISSHDPLSTFEKNYRVLIYDHKDLGCYALAAISDLQGGIAGTEPIDTSYISSACLNALEWAKPDVMSKRVLAWVNRG